MHILTLDVVTNLLLVLLGAVIAWFTVRWRKLPVLTALQRTLAIAALGSFVTVSVNVLLSFSFFGPMRALCWILFLHAPLWLAMHALSRNGWFRVGTSLTALAIALVALDAFLIEPQWLVVTHYSLRSAKLTHPLRIAVIADIQMDAFGPHEREALVKAAAERPDLVLFAGDYLQADNEDTSRAVAADFQRELLQVGLVSTRYGAFAVQGNAELRPGKRNPNGVGRPSNERDWPSAVFGTLPVVSIVREHTEVRGDIAITGLSLDESFDLRGFAPSDPSPDLFHIVLGHAPDYALGDFPADLLVAGHTHGGQVQLPGIGPLLTFSSVPRAWAAGTLTKLRGGATLVVSRGIGVERWEAPRLRFFCRPELVIIDVNPA